MALSIMEMTASSTKKQGKAVWSDIIAISCKNNNVMNTPREPETINGPYHPMLCLQETMNKLLHDHLY